MCLSVIIVIFYIIGKFENIYKPWIGLWNFFIQLKAWVKAAICKALLSCVLDALLPGDMICDWLICCWDPLGVFAAFPELFPLWSIVCDKLPDLLESLVVSEVKRTSTFSPADDLRSLFFFFPWLWRFVAPPWLGDAEVLWDWHSVLVTLWKNIITLLFLNEGVMFVWPAVVHLFLLTLKLGHWDEVDTQYYSHLKRNSHEIYCFRSYNERMIKVVQVCLLKKIINFNDLIVSEGVYISMHLQTL